MKYPALVHKDEKSAFGVTIPDFPGCFTAGDTLDQALANVQEAVNLYLEGETFKPPEPSNIQDLIRDQEPGGSWFFVDINFGDL
ncbi:MAG: type II toxin-antitoxin system HicB family antitoxin [Desulfobacter sp.]|nr:MAG: type II toxin-antitoxin system HicB family antitoxin [Desulfobacter sp.]